MWAAKERDSGFTDFFIEKPYYEKGAWRSDDPLDGVGFLYDSLPGLTFENSPQEVEIKIKKK